MFPQPPSCQGCPLPDSRYDPMAPFVRPGLVRRARPVLGFLLHRSDGVAVALLDDVPANQQDCFILNVIGRKYKDQVYFRVYLKAQYAWLNDFLKRCFERDGRKFPKSGSILLHYVVWYLAGRTAPFGFEIHHKDGNHLNNRLENLEIMTKKQHLAHHRKFPRLPDDLALQSVWVKSEGHQVFTREVEFETRYCVTVIMPKWHSEKRRKRIHNSRNDWIVDHLREQGWSATRVANAKKVLVALVQAGHAGLRSSQEAARGVGLSLPCLRGHLVALTALGYAEVAQGVYRPREALRAERRGRDG